LKRIHYKAIAIVAPLGSFLAMGVALLIGHWLASMNVLTNLVGFEATYMAMLLLVVLTPVFSSVFAFSAVWLLAKDARALNAWIALGVALVIDAVVGFPILVLSAIASR
jgi:hypothetical protein